MPAFPVKRLGQIPARCKHRPVISDEAIQELLRGSWGLADGTKISRHDGGMGSQTWIVDQGNERWVAKSVAPHLAESFARGLEVAQLLHTSGIRAGAPAPARSGSVTVDTASGDRVALLTWVPGSPLTGTGEAQQRLIGDTLARVHRVLRGRQVPALSASTGLTPRPNTWACAPGSGLLSPLQFTSWLHSRAAN
jgi:Ser/Thr protein kinase RdoA (MazF antagonist)